VGIFKHKNGMKIKLRHCKQFKDTYKHMYISHYHDATIHGYGLPTKNTDRLGRGIEEVVYDERKTGEFVAPLCTFSDFG